MENILDNYLNHYSWGKDMNSSLIHAHSQAKFSGFNESMHIHLKISFLDSA